jgi:hypothetical protein
VGSVVNRHADGCVCVNSCLTNEHMFGSLLNMSDEAELALTELEAAARKFLARSERGNVDLKQYWALIVALKHEWALSIAEVDEAKEKQ